MDLTRWQERQKLSDDATLTAAYGAVTKGSGTSSRAYSRYFPQKCPESFPLGRHTTPGRSICGLHLSTPSALPSRRGLCSRRRTAYIIQTVAGTDDALAGASALSAALSQPEGIAVDHSGNVYFADAAVHQVRKIAPDGSIQTIAGTGIAGFSGDGGPASAAQLNQPYGLALDHAGNLYIADLGNARVRKVSPEGVIQTVAGGGTLRHQHRTRRPRHHRAIGAAAQRRSGFRRVVVHFRFRRQSGLSSSHQRHPVAGSRHRRRGILRRRHVRLTCPTECARRAGG